MGAVCYVAIGSKYRDEAKPLSNLHSISLEFHLLRSETSLSLISKVYFMCLSKFVILCFSVYFELRSKLNHFLLKLTFPGC